MEAFIAMRPQYAVAAGTIETARAIRPGRTQGRVGTEGLEITSIGIIVVNDRL